MFSERTLLQITSRVVSNTLRRVINNVCKNENKLKQTKRYTCLVAGCCFSKGTEESSRPSVKYTKLFSDYFREEKHVRENDSQDSEVTESALLKMTDNYCVCQGNRIKQSNVDNGNMCNIEQDHKNLKRKSLTAVGKQTDSVNAQSILPQICDQNVSLNQKKRKLDKGKKIGLSKEPAEKKLRPNYFVAVQISDPVIHRALQEVQNHIVFLDKRFKSAMNLLASLHITLMVMHIGDVETHDRALKALENVHHEYEGIMADKPINLEFKGLGHFQNRVLYAKVSEDNSYERLMALAKSVTKHFAAESIYSTDNKAHFTPHLTIAKLNFQKKAQRQIKKIHPSLYCDYVNQYFGQQTVQGIQLLSMRDKDDTGYYCGNELFFGSHTPPVGHNALSSGLAVREKKLEVKEKIHTLTKKMLHAETS